MPEQPDVAALAWARAQVQPTSCTLWRSRVWAQIWRVDTPDGLWWLKINAHGTSYEPRLLALLNQFRQPLVPAARVHPTRPWSLIADAGEPLRFDLSGPDGEHSRAELLAFWRGLLDDYARLQRSTPVEPLLAAGVPDFAPTRLPKRFAELLEQDEWFEHPELRLDRGTRSRIAALSGAVARASAELSEGVPATVQHDDLHHDNLLLGRVPDGRPDETSDPVVRPVRVIDWGDAVVAHPFGTLRLTLGTLKEVLTGHGTTDRADREMDELTTAYLAGWEEKHTAAELRRQLALAHWLEAITRAAGWIRALGTVENGLRIGHGEAAARWLLRLGPQEGPIP